MDDDQQFCLRWNNHQSTLISVFDTLLENETLVDCTLAAEGKFLKAHKVVLSACSPYFATLLSEQYDKHPIFILKDVKYQELRAMMDYMYRGEVNISQDQLAALLKAAESLQIKGLSDNRTGSGNSSSGLGGGGSQQQQQQQQQKISAEQQQQHKHISVPGKLMTGSASAGYTLEQTKRSRIGPSSIDSQDLSGSREGSSSPTSRRRKKVRRRSIENVLADNHDNSNSSQVIQAGTSSIVPTTNATGAITAMLPMIGSGVGGTTTTISSTVASTITVAAQQQLQQQQQQQASAATAAANIITANVTKKTESVKMGGGNTDAMNAAVTAVENIQDDNAADSIDEKEMLMKEKQNHKRPKHQHEGVVATSTGKDEIVIEPKSEYDDEGNDETVEDLTLDDEEMGLEDLDHNAGPSHGGEGSSQGYAQWQVDRSQDEVFMAAQEAQQRDPQDLSKKVSNHNKDQKTSLMEHHRNLNNRHSMNGMEAMSAASVGANQINGNKKRFSVSDVLDMLYEFYRANSAAKAPKTENTEKSFRQKSPSSADAAAGGKAGSMQSGMPNEPQTSNTTASKNSIGDEMTNTNKIGTTKSSISVRKNTSSFHPRVKYSSVVNKSSAAAAAALANMENTPASIPTSVVVPPPDIKPIIPIPASVIKPTTIGAAAAAPAAAAIAAALLRDGYHNFQQQLRNQDIFKQQSNLVPLAHNNQSGGSVQPIAGQNKGLIFDHFERKENRFSDNENDNSNSEFDEDDDDDDDDDGRYSGFDDIHLIEGSKSSFNHHPNATMPCLSTDYMSDESQKLMMAAQAQALRHLEYSLSDYGGTNPNEEANYQCRHCGKKYRWKSTLRRHENVECGGKEPAHQCPYCAYKSKQRGNLGVHVRKHHSNLPQLASKRRSKYSQQREVKIEKTEKAF